MRYAAASLLATIGIVVAVISFFLFESPWGVIVGGLIFCVGWIINPSRLTKKSPGSPQRSFSSTETSQ